MPATVEFGLEAKQELLDLAPRTPGCGSSPGCSRAALKRLDFADRA